MSILHGIHTFSSGIVLTYKQFKKIFSAYEKTGCTKDTSDIWKGKVRLYCCAYQEQGIKVFLHGRPGKLYRLRVQIEPCRVLGESDPTALAKLDKRQYKKLVKAVDSVLESLEVPCSIDEMKISRCDLTINIIFSSQKELMEYLRIFKKSLCIRHYEHVLFKKHEQKAKDPKTANNHSHCISCDSASFLIYDKIAQLEMIGRMDESLLDKHVLRFEAELKRPALRKHLGEQVVSTNYKLLSSAAKKTEKVIRWYLNRMQPQCDKYVRYEDAVRMVEESGFKKKTKDRMLYLLRKTSDSESLTTALEKLREKYDLSRGQCRTVLKKFNKLVISPITLANSSTYDELRPLLR